MIVTINPATGERLAEYPVMIAGQIDTVLRQADADAREWRVTGFEHRRACMKRLAELLREEAAGHGRIITLEMGKPLSQAVAEVSKCAWVCDYFADHAEQFLQPEESEIDGAKGIVAFEPLGVILGVMPWNFPYWQVLRFAAPILMAGNGIVVKHAPNVTGCSIAIEKLFRDAGFPEHLYRAVHIDLDEVDRLTGFMIDHPVIKAVSVTGSTYAGQAVAAKAGKALKRSVLELGGSDPYIVLEDADLAQAVDACVAGRLLNAGQSCIAAKRFVVRKEIIGEFTKKIVQRMQTAVMGDPFAKSTEVGPIAREDLRDQVHSQVERSVEAGAELLCGGHVPNAPGWYYPPTVLSGVKPGMPAYSEEIFGPVATIIEVSDDDEAVAVSNDSEFGLGSAVFSQEVERALGIARRLEAGSCFINSMVKSDPRLPFGGVKQSGYGRELSHHGIREFVNIKTLYLP
ncbi:NAD-dependent succinate-semialdehyde dehydrogenase [Chlorobaculum sp. 24CR]|uniref:NAD-dependent succinate-semialdehyde dehydrogenase n=1 Tax=Chlorobaculum sp. 24CR TaxID=2508878 RepID=UPI00100A3B9C|nr:NAD-dependent succinate-semialdehyde dehydrogenase [Chlorobaculum sp. 24CR]RXK84548.1 NAD-dependent succinate-semialdehyde dehydrogenase [Chlorobaculum sp. 24CR]